jgi:cytochrome c biogenesis protein CcdA
VAFAAGLASVGAVLVLAGTSLPTSTATTLALITWGAGLCLVLLPLAIGAAILRSRLLTWTRSAAARSPTGCSRCCWPAAMPASFLDSADSWDASPAWW